MKKTEKLIMMTMVGAVIIMMIIGTKSMTKNIETNDKTVVESCIENMNETTDSILEFNEELRSTGYSEEYLEELMYNSQVNDF